MLFSELISGDFRDREKQTHPKITRRTSDNSLTDRLCGELQLSTHLLERVQWSTPTIVEWSSIWQQCANLETIQPQNKRIDIWSLHDNKYLFSETIKNYQLATNNVNIYHNNGPLISAESYHCISMAWSMCVTQIVHAQLTFAENVFTLRPSKMGLFSSSDLENCSILLLRNGSSAVNGCRQKESPNCW